MNINSRTSKINFTGFKSGAIASFTGLRAAPAKVMVNASGVSECNVVRCGKNLFSYDFPIRNGYWTNDSFVGDNAIVPKESAVTWQYIRVYVEGLSSITLSGFDNQGGTNCAWLSSENVNDVISRFNSLNKNGTKIVPSGAKYLCLTIFNIKDKSTTYPNVQLEVGSTATAYEAYNSNTYTIPTNEFIQVEQIIGTNNIFSDSGNVEVYYVTI